MLNLVERLGESISNHLRCWKVQYLNGVIVNLLARIVVLNVDVLATPVVHGVNSEGDCGLVVGKDGW